MQSPEHLIPEVLDSVGMGWLEARLRGPGAQPHDPEPQGRNSSPLGNAKVMLPNGIRCTVVRRNSGPPGTPPPARHGDHRHAPGRPSPRTRRRIKTRRPTSSTMSRRLPIQRRRKPRRPRRRRAETKKVDDKEKDKGKQKKDKEAEEERQEKEKTRKGEEQAKKASTTERDADRLHPGERHLPDGRVGRADVPALRSAPGPGAGERLPAPSGPQVLT